MGLRVLTAGPKPLPIDASAPLSAPQHTGSPLSLAQDEAIADAVARMRADGSYQFDLPSPPAPERPPEWLGDFLHWLSNFTQSFGTLFTVLFWAIVALVVLFLLYMLVPAIRQWVDGLVGRTRLRGAAEVPDDWHPDQQQARDLLAEADALAAAGRFGDAVRLLLGRSLEDINRRRPGVLKPAMTARAISAEPALPPPARSAFGELANIVERAIFALRAISSDEWQTARAAYARFALRDQWAGASA